MRNKQIYLFIAFLLVLILPYMVSYVLTRNGYHFNGFLINPTDGHSYLAKMQIGRNGGWLFKLPYSSQPGEGVFLFTYYIFLGKIAGILEIPNILLFHIIRILNSVFLFIVLLNFIKTYVKENWFLYALLFLIFGSGLGWLGLLFGFVSSDFTTPEIYPFLSCLTNPHFPLAIGLMVIILDKVRELKFQNTIITVFISILLLIIQPFCMVIVLGILGIYYLLTLGENLKAKLLHLGALAFPSILFGLYLTMIIKNNPALSSWNSQNLTPSPPIWDLLLALSPIILPAVYGIVFIIKSKEKTYYPMVIWLILVIVLAYIPLNLQRRFLIGLYIPITILGMKGISIFGEKYCGRFGPVKKFFLATAIPSNIILLALSILAVTQNNPKLVMKETLWSGIQWININTPARSLVLTSSSIGLYIPAYTNDLVVYGHPFETADAKGNLANVEAFFTKMSTEEQQKYLKREGIDYILTAPELNNLPMNYFPMDADVVYQVEDVKIYLVKK
jgi:hypothetical protein